MKLKLLLAGLIILMISLYSCEDKTQTTQNQLKSDVNNILTSNNCYENYSINDIIDSSGIWHNENLDYMFNILQDYKDTIVPVPNNLTWKEFTYNNANGFFTNNCTNLDAIFTIENEINTEFNIKNYADTANISNNAKNILYGLDSIIDANLSNSSKIAFLNVLIANSKSLTDTTEKLMCGIGCSVGKYSLLYWTNRHSDWEDLLNVNESSTNKISRIQKDNNQHAKADVNGACSGAASAAGAVWGTGPQSVITVGLMGAVVGAALGSAKSMQADKPGWDWLGWIDFP